jgi:hypothetical protein
MINRSCTFTSEDENGKDYIEEGTLLDWGIDSEIQGDDNGCVVSHFTVGIIEIEEDGSIVLVPAWKIKMTK